MKRILQNKILKRNDEFFVENSLFQYKLRSTAIIATGSIVPMFGIGVYYNDSKFYDNVLMPIVQLCPPELSHRLAVLAFKFNLIPKQKDGDSERLVSDFRFIRNNFISKFM